MRHAGRETWISRSFLFAEYGRWMEPIESGEMRKTDDDQLEDFVDVYDFHKAFVEEYEIDTVNAFSRS